jgi:hypothetical protein
MNAVHRYSDLIDHPILHEVEVFLQRKNQFKFFFGINKDRTKIRKWKTYLIGTLNKILIDFIINWIGFWVINEFIQMRKIFIHPNMNVLILNVSNMNSPWTSMNKTSWRIFFKNLRSIITINRFIIILKLHINRTDLFLIRCFSSHDSFLRYK